MSAWYYVIDGNPAFLMEEDDAQPGRPLDWDAAMACVQGTGGTVDEHGAELKLPGLWVQVEPVDDGEDEEIRGVGFNVGTSGTGDDTEGMAQLVKLMLAVADAVGGRAWSDDQQRWLTPADVDGARRGDPI